MNLENIQKLIADMYKKNQIDKIQIRSAKIYKLCLSKGLSHIQAVNLVLSHGVKYNDLLSGILTLGIDQGVNFNE